MLLGYTCSGAKRLGFGFEFGFRFKNKDGEGGRVRVPVQLESHQSEVQRGCGSGSAWSVLRVRLQSTTLSPCSAGGRRVEHHDILFGTDDPLAVLGGRRRRRMECPANRAGRAAAPKRGAS